VRKAESKHENENISTGESLPVVPGVISDSQIPLALLGAIL